MGVNLLHPSIDIQQAIADVADLGQFDPELAPRGKPVDGQLGEPGGDSEQQQAGNEPKIDFRARFGVQGVVRNGTGPHKSHFNSDGAGRDRLQPFPSGDGAGGEFSGPARIRHIFMVGTPLHVVSLYVATHCKRVPPLPAFEPVPGVVPLGSYAHDENKSAFAEARSQS